MAGHSQFKNIMYRKGAQDAKRAKVFTKLIRELTVASKEGGADPSANPRLRSAISAAKSSNLPKDTMEKAINRGTNSGVGSKFEAVRYEGYAPGGVAFIVDALTDNRNRTAGEVRAAFVKHGGVLGETNSVAFQFDRVGSIRVETSKKDSDEMLELAIELGVEEVIDTNGQHEFITTQENFYNIRNSLESKISSEISAELIWKPKNLIKIDNENAEKVLKIFETLEESDDVQTVSSNFEISDETLNKLSG
ncbi:MAG: putative transcriptional regulatory protein [Alphaproteobacteria bacterium MarineAlpha2_Bin1]|nr:MAG: putative transcriptional regulatory protein [Alphaproteobacteria bacterium MarineAlpha2_Bin1]